jgi:hypothetical protein
MNKLDDFLRSKIDQASINSPSNWEALNQAIPKKTTSGIAKWAFALLLLGGLGTSVFLLKNNGNIVSSTSSNTPIKSVDNTPTDLVNKVETNKENQNLSPVVMVPATNSYQAVAPASPSITNPVVTPSNTTPVIGNNSQEKTSSEVPVLKNESSNDLAKNNEKNAEPVTNAIPTKADDVVKNNMDEENSSPTIVASPNIRKKSRKDYHKGKLYATASVSSIFSYRSFQLSNGAAPFVNKMYSDTRLNSEVMNLGYGATLALEYRFSKSLSLQGGFSYNKIGYKSRYDFEVTDKAITDNNGRIIGYENLSNPVSVNSSGKTKIDVLRIPVGINYNLFLNQYMLFHFYVGASHNVLLSASGNGLNQLTMMEQKVSKADFVNSANEVCFDLGVSIAINSKYGFGIDLYYNKWLTNISRNKYENVVPFSPGMNFSLSRNLF